MSLNCEKSKIISQIETTLINAGYEDIENDLIIYGGKNNGTIDLKASTKDKKQSVVVEIKRTDLFTMDIAHFFNLKENIHSNKEREEEIQYFIVLIDQAIALQNLKDLAESKEIKIITLNEFMDKFKPISEITI